MSDKEDGEISGTDSEELPTPAPQKNVFPHRLKLNSDSEDTDRSDNEEKSPTKSITPSTRGAAQSDYERMRRKMNIWSNVLSEQDLTNSLSSNLNSAHSIAKIPRGPESYTRTCTEILSRNREEIIEPVVHQDELWNVREDGESRNVKSRLGKRAHDYISYHITEEDAEGYDMETEFDLGDESNEVEAHPCADDTEEQITRTICSHLYEQKGHLIMRIVKIFGKKRSIDVYNMTRDVEEAGGMFTESRERRSPGGVFLQLLKNHKDLTKEMKRDIFAPEKARSSKLKKEAKKRKLEKKYGLGPPADNLQQEMKTKRSPKKKKTGAKVNNDSIGNDKNGLADDDFEQMDEPDVEIGVNEPCDVTL